MFEVEKEDTDDWRQHRRAVRHQLEWTPVVANGSLLLALLGIVGSATDPDKAMLRLTIPLLWFGVGAGVGLIAAQRSLELQHLKVKEARHFDLLNQAQEKLVEDGVIPSGPVDILAAPAELEKPIRKALNTHSKAILLEHHCGVLRWCSLALCLTGFLGFVLGHLLGAFQIQ